MFSRCSKLACDIEQNSGTDGDNEEFVLPSEVDYRVAEQFFQYLYTDDCPLVNVGTIWADGKFIGYGSFLGNRFVA